MLSPVEVRILALTRELRRRDRQARRFARELWQRDEAALTLSTEQDEYVLRIERPDGRADEYRWARAERDEIVVPRRLLVDVLDGRGNTRLRGRCELRRLLSEAEW